MNEASIAAIAAWVHASGLAGASETDLLEGFSERCREAGLPLDRSLALIDTLHPIYEGRVFRWSCDGSIDQAMTEYGPTNQGPEAANWRRSTFYHLLQTGGNDLRLRLDRGEHAAYWGLQDLVEHGHVDYLAMVNPFAQSGTIGEMDCFYSHWLTRRPEGFGDEDIEALRRLVPSLALAIKCTSVTRIAGTLVEVYLGQDAGQRVLSGRIARGVAERINAVLWFSDLRDYTRIADGARPDEVIPLLNDYAEAVIASIHAAGGNVLKLIGDGVLAIFKSEPPEQACLAALDAEADLRRRLAELTTTRRKGGHPLTDVYLGLHIGDVFYGNIGSDERLDFTVVGPAVNEVSRIAAMCRSVDRSIVMSSDFAATTPAARRADLVSVGRYALRGVGRAQELFTLDPGLRIRAGADQGGGGTLLR